jgi:transposase-like protein
MPDQPIPPEGLWGSIFLTVAGIAAWLVKNIMRRREAEEKAEATAAAEREKQEASLIAALPTGWQQFAKNLQDRLTTVETQLTATQVELADTRKQLAEALAENAILRQEVSMLKSARGVV